MEFQRSDEATEINRLNQGTINEDIPVEAATPFMVRLDLMHIRGFSMTDERAVAVFWPRRIDFVSLEVAAQIAAIRDSLLKE